MRKCKKCEKELCEVISLELKLTYLYCKSCDEFYLEDEYHNLKSVDPRCDDMGGDWTVTVK
jgi:hypothetical protein